MQELRNKVVLVTGASSGIGWAAALAFAKRGSRLVLAARRQDKLKELARLVRENGGDSIEIACDVRDAGQAKEAVEAAVRRWQRLDVLINNAGILDTGPFHKQDVRTIEDIVRTNVLGCMYMLHAALPCMLRQKDGHIVNVASMAGLVALPRMAVYSSSKFAVVGLTEALRRELSGTGVTLTALCPGVVDTPMARPLRLNRRRFHFIRTAEQVAEEIVWAAQRRVPEVVNGEAPSVVVKLTKFFPRVMDKIIRRLYDYFVPAQPR